MSGHNVEIQTRIRRMWVFVVMAQPILLLRDINQGWAEWVANQLLRIVKVEYRTSNRAKWRCINDSFKITVS